MRLASDMLPVLPKDLLGEIEERWQRALVYFRRRKSVLFISYCRFWEKHAFVQQSIAKLLVENGVKVTWLDGGGWRPYEPTLYFNSNWLTVRRQLDLPGQRFLPVKAINSRMQAADIRREMAGLGGEPIVWIQAGMDEDVAGRLPYLDVLSTFDDPYRCQPNDPSTRDSRLIVCQNTYTYQLLGPEHHHRAFVSLPPIDMSAGVFEEKPIELPRNFPKRVMGYVGTFFGDDYDLPLFESFVRSLPDWGFLLMGRTGPVGKAFMDKFAQYSNFHYIPWAPRSQVAGAWRAIDVTLLLYRPRRSQDGAFPTKIVESTYFGASAVATCVPKTQDLEGFFSRCSFPDRLKKLAVQAGDMDQQQIRKAFEHFAYETNPKLHLARVAEFLQSAK